MRNFELIQKHAQKTAERLFERLSSLRKDMLDVATEFYPLGRAGWEHGVESLADKGFHDDDHRMLTVVPMQTARRAAAGMLQNLTSKGQPWFYLSVPKVLKGGLSRERRLALEKLTEATRNLMARSNIYCAIYRLFVHYLVFGYGCMLISKAEDNSTDVVQGYTLRPGTYALSIGKSGRVESVARKFAWKPIQILEEFGVRNTPKWIRDAAKKGSERYIVVWNLIEPNHTGELRKYDPVSSACDLSNECRWRSVFWVDGGDNSGDDRHGVLGIDGFDINPIIAPRLDCEYGDTYGRGLGLDGLDLARGLQSLRYDSYKITTDKSQPALLASSDFKDDGLRCGRGEINYCRPGEQRQSFVVPVLPNPPDTRDVREIEVIVKNEMETLFYIDAFTAMDLFRDSMGKVTATQINYAKAEGMQKLGAMVSNCEVEFLNTLVNTCSSWALKAKLDPIDEKTVAIIAEILSFVAPEYVSNIHQARRFAEMNGIQAWLQNVAATKEITGESVLDPADIIDADTINRRMAEILNVPTECMRDEKLIAEARQRRSEAAQAMQEAEMIDKGASAANKLGNTPITEDRLLAPLARAATGIGV